MNSLLSVKNLTVNVSGKNIVDDVSFDVSERQIVALVGGSGSGKTTIARSILRLLPSALQITRGQMLFRNDDLLTFSPEQMRNFRGSQVGMVFQEPLYAFNPLLTIGQQIDEVLAAHTQLDKSARSKKVLEVLSLVQLPDPKRARDSYPHQLSGGMRQRAMMAQAIACQPALIIADEPTSSMDVILQAKMIGLLGQVVKHTGASILIITHDLGMVSYLADELIVLKEGRVVEKGKTHTLMSAPSQEYTKQLIEVFR